MSPPETAQAPLVSVPAQAPLVSIPSELKDAVWAGSARAAAEWAVETVDQAVSQVVPEGPLRRGLHGVLDMTRAASEPDYKMAHDRAMQVWARWVRTPRAPTPVHADIWHAVLRAVEATSASLSASLRPESGDEARTAAVLAVQHALLAQVHNAAHNAEAATIRAAAKTGLTVRKGRSRQ